MVITSQNKDLCIQEFIDHLEMSPFLNKVDSSKIGHFFSRHFLNDEEKLCYIFSKYCLYDLGLDDVEISFSRDRKNRYGSIYKNHVEINSKYLKSDLPLALNTIAHEIRHKYQALQKNYKKLDFYTQNYFPIYNFSNQIYSIIYDENGYLFHAYYTSQTEKDARDYASKTLEYFLTEIYLRSSGFAKSWARTALIRCEENEKKENQMYETELKALFQNANNIQNYAKYLIEKIAKYSTGEDTLPDNHIENYLKMCKKRDGSYSSAYKELLNYYSSPEIRDLLLKKSFLLKDFSTITMLLNHPNVYFTEDEILKCLAILTKRNSLNFDTAKKNLYAFSDDDIIKIYNAYNQKLNENDKNSSKKPIILDFSK